MMLMCMAPTRVLCFDLNNGQMTFKSKKSTFKVMGQLTMILMRIIGNQAVMQDGVWEQKGQIIR